MRGPGKATQVFGAQRALVSLGLTTIVSGAVCV